MHPSLPPLSFGPGSQPVEDDGAHLACLGMPQHMATYAPPTLPDCTDAPGLCAARLVLERLLEALRGHRLGTPAALLDLGGLDRASRDLLDKTLGEGEVSILSTGPEILRVQETRLAGVWRFQARGETGRPLRDLIEVGDVPRMVRTSAFRGARKQAVIVPTALAGVMNAPPVLVELNHRAAIYRPGGPAHVVNLTLLPQSADDLAYLDACLGLGPLSILSRGFGNCRITATGVEHVWWVQHFNSEERLILSTLEVVDVPAAALAAQEDLDDSAMRLAEILEALR